MNEIEQLERRGRELLEELAANPDSDCWRQFDALFYEPVWRYLRANHAILGARVARYLKVDEVIAPEIPAEQVNDVAHDATLIALRRVRQNAARFDAARGTCLAWVISAAEWAWIDVVKAVSASGRLQFVSPEDLADEPDSNPTTEEHVLRQLSDAEALADAAGHLDENEFAAIRLVITGGYSYGEAAK